MLLNVVTDLAQRTCLQCFLSLDQVFMMICIILVDGLVCCGSIGAGTLGQLLLAFHVPLCCFHKEMIL